MPVGGSNLRSRGESSCFRWSLWIPKAHIRVVFLTSYLWNFFLCISICLVSGASNKLQSTLQLSVGNRNPCLHSPWFVDW